MASTATYLNFKDSTEEAFNFYKSVFGTEFVGPIFRFGDIAQFESDAPPVADDVKHLVMNVTLPITGGHLLMGTDAPESMGFSLNQGNNVYISVNPDTREEADELFAGLSAGGTVEMAQGEQFWGYFGSLVDKFGVRWMVNVAPAG